MADTPLTYEQIEEAAEYIKNASKTTARIAVITGAALGVIPKSCLHGEELPCGKIPNVGECFEEDCKDCPNVLYAGAVGNAPVIAMTGKAHILSRKTMCKTGLFIKAFKLLGVDTVILIGPAGALNPDYKVGDLMIVKDHVNFMGMAGYNPLIGKNDDRFGPRFLSLNKAYSEQLGTTLNTILQEVGYDGKVHEGIYVGITGPFYPTLAEKEFLRSSSRGDAIGMYLIPEVLLARYCGMNVVAVCLITEECPTETSTKVEESNFENVMVVGEQKIEALNNSIEKMIAQLEVGRPVTAKEAEIDAQSTFTAGPCCRCNKKKK